MKKYVYLIILSTLMLLLMTACGGPRGESPTDVVKAFYKAGNEGDYAKAKNYLSIHTQMALENMRSLGMLSFEEQMDVVTKEGTIARIEIKGGQEAGHVVVVYVTLYYKDGTREQDVVTLLKENEKWKIYKSTLLMKPPVKM